MLFQSKLFLNFVFWASISALFVALGWLSRDPGLSWRRVAFELVLVAVLVLIRALVRALVPERIKEILRWCGVFVLAAAIVLLVFWK
jgi:hypothetical protein